MKFFAKIGLYQNKFAIFAICIAKQDICTLLYIAAIPDVTPRAE